jgi:hypothetical protein
MNLDGLPPDRVHGSHKIITHLGRAAPSGQQGWVLPGLIPLLPAFGTEDAFRVNCLGKSAKKSDCLELNPDLAFSRVTRQKAQ